MRTLTLGGLVAAAVLLGQTPPAPDPIGPRVAGVRDAVIASWTAPATSVDSSPLLDLAGYELAVAPATEDLAAGGTALQPVLTVDRGALEADLGPILAGKPRGLYRVWARSLDDARNTSPWVGAVRLVDWDGLAPAAPTGLDVRVEVRITVGVTR